MFLLDETGRFLYTKYGKSEEGVQTLGEKIIHGIHRFLEILEIVLAAIIVLVLVALMGIEIWELARDPSVFLAEGFLDSFLSSITSLVVAVEFVKMLLRPTVGNTLELLIMALSRYVVLNHHEPVSLAADINGFELLELLRSSNVGNSPTIPVVVATASGSCNKGELLAKGFAGCLFKPFSISELMEVSDRCAIKATPDGKPDFSALLSYGNEAVMLEKLITETEKEMQAVRDAAKEKDLQKLDSLIHHLRSSWEVLRADQPLNVLYGLLRGDALPDGEALSHAVTAVLDKGVEIIRLAEEERRKYEDE